MPADFRFALHVPGAQDELRRPGKVVFDPAAGEVYVADLSNNRIVIFDENGTYKFEFSTGGYCGSVVDFAVSAAGTIYVLGSTRDGARIFQFDFDGAFLDGFPVAAADRFTSLAIDAQQRLYLLDPASLEVVTAAPDGTIRSLIRMFRDTAPGSRQEIVLGALTIADETIYVPVSSLGTVYRYTLEGTPLPPLGFAGSTPGEFAFPVAVAVAPDGMILVLDKQRFNVLCFATDGTFVGEFGGKGINYGWFYYPSWIAADSRGHVYISQIFQNRVQACVVPKPIQDFYLQHGAERDVEPALQSFVPVRHPRITAAQDRNTNAVITNHNVTKTPTQLWEV